MHIVFGILYLVVLAYLLVLISRFILDTVQSYARDFRPRGAVLIAFEVVYTVTDPPLKLLRRLIPPLRLGGVALDLGSLLLIVVLWFLLPILQRLA